MDIFSIVVLSLIIIFTAACFLFIFPRKKKQKPSTKKLIKPKPLTQSIKISAKVFRDVLYHFNRNHFRKNGFYTVNRVNDLYRRYRVCVLQFGIKSEEYFLAQVLHESQFLRLKEENLKYSAEALVSLFGKYFKSLSMAKMYEKNSKAIANVVYANRIGNGGGSSGDGWKFRGRGYIQLTGRANYEEFSMDVGIDAIKNPESLSYDKYAWFVAGWFWKRRGLDGVSNFKEATKIINGGYNGLDHRQDILNIIESKMSG